MKKTAIVTGASRGIGKETALMLANDFNVVVNYKNNEKMADAVCNEICKKGLCASPFCADVADYDSMNNLADFTIKTYGSIDVLINNAGIAQQKVFCDITREDYEHIMNVNVGGVFNATKAVMSEMINKKSGKIINLSSVWGLVGASCEVHYSASKAAIIGFTKALAKELAPSGIMVNCVAPGAVNTDMCNFDSETKNLVEQDILMGKMAEPSQIAKVICFLCSEAANYITGQVLNVSGGYVI